MCWDGERESELWPDCRHVAHLVIIAADISESHSFNDSIWQNRSSQTKTHFKSYNNKTLNIKHRCRYTYVFTDNNIVVCYHLCSISFLQITYFNEYFFWKIFFFQWALHYDGNLTCDFRSSWLFLINKLNVNFLWVSSVQSFCFFTLLTSTLHGEGLWKGKEGNFVSEKRCTFKRKLYFTSMMWQHSDRRLSEEFSQ